MSSEKSNASVRVLMVDDEPALLDAMRRAHRKVYHLSTANSGDEALKMIAEEDPFTVVVSDYTMPGMNGSTLLQRIREVAPETVRVMLTGNADVDAAIEAVNKGEIFRFLGKPCSDVVFRGAIDAAIELHHLKSVERDLLEKTLQGSIQVLADILALVNPIAFGRAARVRQYVQQITEALGLEEQWKYETAAMLSQIGCVAVPSEILEASAVGKTLTADQQEILQRHPKIARDLLSHIPRLEDVAEMLARQSFDTPNDDEEPCSKVVERGGHILSLALLLDAHICGGATRDEAVSILLQEKHIDPQLRQAIGKIELPEQNAIVAAVPVHKLCVGMILDQDVRNDQGALLVSRGQDISPSLLVRLQNYAKLGALPRTIRVHVQEDAGQNAELSTN